MKIQRVLLGLLVFNSLCFVPVAEGSPVPLPVKKKFTITSVAPLENLWGALSERNKKLAFHLQSAARAGRDLLFIQSHRHSLFIKELLETALNTENFASTRAGF